MDINRRTLLAGISYVLIHPLIARSYNGSSLANIQRAAFPSFDKIGQNLAAAAAIGAAYLAERPCEASKSILMANLASPESDTRFRYFFRPRTDTMFCMSRIIAMHKNDCKCMNMVNLKGCLLSRTEARLYALISLQQRERA